MIKRISLRNFFILSAAIFLSACDQGNKNETISTQKNDIATVKNNSLERTIGLFKEGKLPFVVDTSLLFRIGKYDSLGTFEIKTLAGNWFKHDLLEATEYGLETFCKIDSIKACGKYTDYCASLNIGMTKVSSAHAISRVRFDANTLLLIWGLFASSYEACPFSTSYSAYGTIIYKGNVGETFLLGEYISAGDPPVSMERTVNGKLMADGTFTIDVSQMNDQDMDLPEIEMIRENYSFAIQDGAIKLLSEKKEKPHKIKRKKV